MPLYRVGEVWYIDLPTSKGRLRRSAGTADKKEAQALHDEVKARIWRQEKLGESPPILWEQAIAKWLGVKDRGMPDKYRLRALSVPLSARLPLSQEMIESALAGLSPGSYNRALALIVAIHNTSQVSPPTVARKPNPRGRTRWLSKEEWARLQKALKKESPLLEQCARFALATGLRENNVLELEWSQVDLRRRQAVIYADQMKQGKTLGIRLPDVAMDVLGERKGLHKQFVFAHPDSGKPLVKASNRAWYNALKKSSLYKTGVNFHCLRHTWASWHVMGGTRIEELMHLGGWASLHMVQRYAHLATEHLAAIAEQSKPVSRKGHNAPRKGKARHKSDIPGG